MKRSILFAVLVALAQLAGATNYYVSPIGDNSGKGTMETPYLTIGKAAQMAKAGDTVFVAAGTYTENNIKPANSGSQSKGYIVFRPWTGTVKLSKPETTVSDNAVPIFDISEKSHIWIEGFEFCDMTYLLNCIKMTKSQQCVVTGCRFYNLGNAEINATWGGGTMIWVYNASDCTISNCVFQNVTGGGIDVIGQSAKRNLICHNKFEGLKGKKASWDETGKGHFSAGISISDTSQGDNLICFNHFVGGQDGIWLDRDGSTNILVRNFGNGGQRLVFNESRCARNWIQENVAIDMTESGYRSALYDGTNWSFDSRYVNNVAYRCKVGFYMHKSKHNEVRDNIAYACTDYCLLFTDSAAKYGNNVFRNNLWHIASKNNIIQYCGTNMNGATFATKSGEVGGIYRKSPQFAQLTAPFDFTLQETSPCIGAGDEGVDVGAYPVYTAYPAGSGTPQTSHKGTPQAGFENLVTETLRGETHTIGIRLTKAATHPITVKIEPVSGELREGSDFQLSASEVTFATGETVKEVTISFMGGESEFSKLIVFKLLASEGSSFASRNYTAFKLITAAEKELMEQTNVWLEAEDGSVGSLWNSYSDTRAAGGKYIMVKAGYNANNTAPTIESGWVTYTFHIKAANTYALWLRTICPTANDDSFWIRMDDGDWKSWNGIPSSTSWAWNQASGSYYLAEGTHTLSIGYREDGSKLDKLLVSCNGTVPTGMGEDPSSVGKVVSAHQTAPADYLFYNLTGQPVARVKATGQVEAIQTAHISPGIYVVKCIQGKEVQCRKIVIK